MIAMAKPKGQPKGSNPSERPKGKPRAKTKGDSTPKQRRQPAFDEFTGAEKFSVFGTKIRAAMQKKGLYQRHVGKAIGKSQSRVSKITRQPPDRDDYVKPTRQELLALSRLLECSLLYLCDDKLDEDPEPRAALSAEERLILATASRLPPGEAMERLLQAQGPNSSGPRDQAPEDDGGPSPQANDGHGVGYRLGTPEPSNKKTGPSARKGRSKESDGRRR